MTVSTRGRSLAAFLGLVTGSIAAFVILFAFAAFVMITPARAADLNGGACCADLEERVAELEATVAKKGNRKVTLQIYGQVHKAMMFTDISGLDNKRGYMLDPSQDPSLIGFMGEAKVSPNLKVGYVLEVQIANSSAQGVDLGKSVIGFPNAPDGKNELQFGEQGIAVRRSYFWLETPAGKVSLGQTSMATDGIIEINTANTNVAVRPLSVAPVMFGGAVSGLNIPFDGYRANVIRYDSPTLLSGLILSASMAEDDSWDATARYAGEAGGFRFAFGAGYRDAKAQTLVNLFNFADILTVDVSGSHKALSGSASVKHIQSGLFATAFYSRVTYDLTADVGFFGIPIGSGPIGSARLTGYGGQTGIEKNWFGVGNTTLFVEYQRFDGSFEGAGFGPKPTIIGAGIVQALDAASTDLYVNWRQLDLDTVGAEKGNSLVAGARIRF